MLVDVTLQIYTTITIDVPVGFRAEREYIGDGEYDTDIESIIDSHSVQGEVESWLREHKKLLKDADYEILETELHTNGRG